MNESDNSSSDSNLLFFDEPDVAEPAGGDSDYDWLQDPMMQELMGLQDAADAQLETQKELDERRAAEEAEREAKLEAEREAKRKAEEQAAQREAERRAAA